MIDKIIEDCLNNEKIKAILSQAAKDRISPVYRVSELIGEIYTYCFVHNDGANIDVNDVIHYVQTMQNAYTQYHGNESVMLDIRAKELGKSIAKKLNIDISSGRLSKDDEQLIQDYFLKNYVENGYVMHSFSGACEDSIRENGFSSSKRIWDNDEIMRIAHIFEEKNVISPVGGYSHYSGGGMYVADNPRNLYWHALSAPEWFKWFTSANHNKNSFHLEDSPYFLKNYEGCKQNVQDLCTNAGLTEGETEQVLAMFENNWKVLGTERMCVALIPKKTIGKGEIEDAIIPGQSTIQTIKTVLSDGRCQYKEHDGNVLKKTITAEDMLIMGLPNALELFGEHGFNRESKESLYDPQLVLDMVFRGTKVSGFNLSQEKIDSIIETLREVHKSSPEVERAIQEYITKVSKFSDANYSAGKRFNDIVTSILTTSISAKDSAEIQVERDLKNPEKDKNDNL